MHPLTSIPLERMHRFGKSLRTYIYIYVYIEGFGGQVWPKI
jgi:hypothetical protein